MLALKSIPALYEALRYQCTIEGHLTDMLGVCCWLEKRAKEVLDSVIQHQADPPDGFHRPDNDWQKVRTYNLLL